MKVKKEIVQTQRNSIQEKKKKLWNREQKQKFALISILIIFSILASLYFDSILIRYVSSLRNNALDSFFLGVTFISSEIIIFLVLTSMFVWRAHKRRWILPLWISFGISAIISFILKITIQRPRPFQLLPISLITGLQASYSTWNFSFPSSHAMLAFCAIPILSQQYPKLKKVWVAVAVLIALSRIYLGLHFTSDIIAGAFIGYLIGFMVVKLEKEHKFGRDVYNKIFRK